MNRWKKWCFLLMVLIGIGGLAFSAVMTVMAVRFLELGRVLFYGVLAVLSMELAGYSLFRLIRKRD